MRKFTLILMCLTATHFAIGQKLTKKPIVISYFVNPAQDLDASLKKYEVAIVSPLDPLSWSEEVDATAGIKDSDKRREALAQARKNKLIRYASAYLTIKGNDLISVKVGGDFEVQLETSQMDVTTVDQRPIRELADDDIVYRYSFSAKLTVKDKSGAVLFEQYVHEDEVNQKVTKGELLLNPTLKMKMGLAKNNPEKQKKLIQRRIDKAGHYILEDALIRAQEVLNNNLGRPYIQSSLAIFGVKGKAYGDLADANEKLLKTHVGFHAFSKKKRLPKADLEQAYEEALVVWQKYIAEKSGEIEEKALKGLKLNCAIANCWLGNVAAAGKFIAEVPEAVPNEIGDKDEDVEVSSSGAMMTFDFTGYAANVRDFYDRYESAGDRIEIKQ